MPNNSLVKKVKNINIILYYQNLFNKAKIIQIKFISKYNNNSIIDYFNIKKI